MTIDWTQVLIAALAGLPAMLVALGTLIASLRTQAQIVTLKEHVNSKMDELVKSTERAAGLEGEKRGRQEQKEKSN